jgi:16S rRNA (guanine527-N7)-methyltransferase
MESFKAQAHTVGVELNDTQIEFFSVLLKELIEWNKTTNLTAIRTPEDIISKHFLDSVSVVQAIPSTAHTLIDIGTGAGFPGLPIKIVRPDIEITLLESVGKKVAFLEHVVQTLKLTNVHLICNRAEEIGQAQTEREHYDVAIARAVAGLATLVEYALPLVKVGGIVIAQKIMTEEEVTQAQNALTLLGGTIEKIIPITIPGLSERHLIVIKKIAQTPSEYPRKIGTPLKDPL